MDKKQNKVSIGFQLIKITTEQFAIIPDEFDKNETNIEMSIDLKFGLDEKKRIIAPFIKVQFEQNKKTFIVVEVANHFSIEKNAWDSFDRTEKNIIIPKGFASHLVMLTIGTLRGVLHCKLENTEFNSFILPAINVTKMIKSDVEINKALNISNDSDRETAKD